MNKPEVVKNLEMLENLRYINVIGAISDDQNQFVSAALKSEKKVREVFIIVGNDSQNMSCVFDVSAAIKAFTKMILEGEDSKVTMRTEITVFGEKEEKQTFNVLEYKMSPEMHRVINTSYKEFEKYMDSLVNMNDFKQQMTDFSKHLSCHEEDLLELSYFRALRVKHRFQ